MRYFLEQWKRRADETWEFMEYYSLDCGLGLERPQAPHILWGDWNLKCGNSPFKPYIAHSWSEVFFFNCHSSIRSQTFRFFCGDSLNGHWESNWGIALEKSGDPLNFVSAKFAKVLPKYHFIVFRYPEPVINQLLAADIFYVFLAS